MKIPPWCTLIFDHDGTITHSSDLARKFMRGYLSELAQITGRPIEDIWRVATRLERDMRFHPERYDWTFNGSVVSSLVGDPSLRFIAIVDAVLTRFPPLEPIGDRSALERDLFWRHYPTHVQFRAGARRLLAARPDAWVVSNSPAGRIEEKLSRHFSPGRVQVMGEAGKQWIDDSFTQVPRELAVNGLHRPVLLRRRRYFDTLSRVLAATGGDWSTMFVVGDNFELDLALPMALGAHGILITSPFTPPWETAHVRSHARGTVIRSFRDLTAA